MRKIAIGFIAYGESTAKYLPYFLNSLKEQTRQDFELIVVDNTPEKDNGNVQVLKEFYPDVEAEWPGENIGFSRAYNIMIKKAASGDAEYFIALNPDIILENDFIEKIVQAIKSNDRIGSIAPLIYRWNFEKKENGKTNIIDSCGIAVDRCHRFYDIRQGEVGNEKMKQRFIFGGTGAAVLYRVKALESITSKYDGKIEYFDELMFMYKEDCDLAYRLQLAGWKTMFYPPAVCYHDRTASGSKMSIVSIMANRKNKNKQINKWSYYNHRIILKKYCKLPHSLTVKMFTCWYEFKKLVYIMIFERCLLKELRNVKKVESVIKGKAKAVKMVISKDELIKLFE